MHSLIITIPLLIAIVYRYIITPYFLCPLSKIPNAHITSPLSTYWISRIRQTGNEVLIIHSLHRKHGPVIRLAPKELSVNSLHGLRIIYTGAFEKHTLYSDMFINFHTDNLVGMVHNGPHAHQKRMLSRVYSKSYLQGSPDVRDLSAMILNQRLLPILHQLATTGAETNVLPLFQAAGMDFISSYIFGTQNGTTFLFSLPEWQTWLAEYDKFKYLSREERAHGFIEAWCLSLCRRMGSPALSTPDILAVDRPLPHNDSKVQRTTMITRSTNNGTYSRHEISSATSTNPVVYNQLRQSLEKSLEGTNPRPIELTVASELLDHLIAGHETSGITFTYIMWELSQRPQLQAKLREELLTLLPNPLRYPCTKKPQNDTPGDSTKPIPTLPTAAAIDSLPLLDAIVRETLRLHAPAPAPLPRITPENTFGTSIDGYDGIPGGVRVASSAYTLHRIEEVYSQPTEWLPNRWLEPGQKIHNMRRLFWAFGSGGRKCLGSNFALQEIKLVTAAIYTNYTTSIVDDEGIEQDYEFIALPKGRKLILKFSLVE